MLAFGRLDGHPREKIRPLRFSHHGKAMRGEGVLGA